MDYLTSFVGARTPLPSKKWGTLTVESASFSPAADGDLVIEIGELDPSKELLLRIHSECVFSEVLSSKLCECWEQLDLAMSILVANGSGMLVYLRFDGRGAGLAAKVKATALEVAGTDTYSSRQVIGVPPEARNFESIGRYLVARGFQSVRMLTNNPQKVEALRQAGLSIISEPLLISAPSGEVKALYRTKSERFGHSIPPQLYEDDAG